MKKRWLCNTAIAMSTALIAGLGITEICSLAINDVVAPQVAIETVVEQKEQEKQFIEIEVAPIIETESETASLFSEDERNHLAKIAMAEAEGESLEGKAYVIRTVLNRVESDKFPDTIDEVLFQRTPKGGYQFAPMSKGGRWYTTEPTEECFKAVKMVEEGWDDTDGALYFESSKAKSTWHSRHLTFLYKVGNHKFYK